MTIKPFLQKRLTLACICSFALTAMPIQAISSKSRVIIDELCSATNTEQTEMLRDQGDTLLKRRDFSGAIQKYRAAIELCPSADRYFYLAFAYKEDQKFLEAKNALEKIEKTHLRDVSKEQFEHLFSIIQEELQKVDYTFVVASSSFSLLDNYQDKGHRVLIGQETFTTPRTIRLKPGEVVLDIDGVGTERLKLKNIPSTVMFYELRDRKLNMRIGLPLLLCGLASVTISAIFTPLALSDRREAPGICNSNGIQFACLYNIPYAAPMVYSFLGIGVPSAMIGGLMIAFYRSKSNKYTIMPMIQN